MRIGIDLGGTKIEAIALSPAGQEITRLRVTTPRDYAASLDAIAGLVRELERAAGAQDRKSTRLNSSHTVISYAVFCLKKKKKTQRNQESGQKTNSSDHTARHMLRVV